MRKVFRNSAECAHMWAHSGPEREGRAGNVFFRNGVIYSYGHHFAIAKHISPDVVAFTTRDYSISTTRHKSLVRSAIRHKSLVWCRDPAGTAADNMDAALREIRQSLDSAEKPRIRQKTRDGHKGDALHAAESFNAYLAALPEAQRGRARPIPTDALEAARQSLIAAEEAQRQTAERIEEERKADLLESLALWRRGEIVLRTGLQNLPCALRLSADGSEVQTSWGASVPVDHARRALRYLDKAGRDPFVLADAGMAIRMGHFFLDEVTADGIRAGCHRISWQEIDAIRPALESAAAEAAA